MALCQRVKVKPNIEGSKPPWVVGVLLTQGGFFMKKFNWGCGQ
jgi:hypothetical protein